MTNNKNQNLPRTDWSYNGENGPDQWHQQYPDCCGSSQSPVDLRNAIRDETLKPLDIQYQGAILKLMHKGVSIEFGCESESYIRFNRNEYRLIQFHFHTPAEHSVEGRICEMECHLVHHCASRGEFLVVGILFAKGAENGLIRYITHRLPSQKGDTLVLNDPVDVLKLIPTHSSYYTYQGSLTTPPCTENVHWFVMKEQLTVSPEQIEKFHRMTGSNARPVQALKDRVIRQFKFSI